MFAGSRTHTSMRRSRLAHYRQRRAFAEKQSRQLNPMNFVKRFEVLQLFTRIPKPFQTGSKPSWDVVGRIGLKITLNGTFNNTLVSVVPKASNIM